jgi:hypothetical protein
MLHAKQDAVRQVIQLANPDIAADSLKAWHLEKVSDELHEMGVTACQKGESDGNEFLVAGGHHLVAVAMGIRLALGAAGERRASGDEQPA